MNINKTGKYPHILHFKIRAARRNAKMTQQQLADALGVSRPAVSLWESTKDEGRNAPTRTNLENLSEITGAPLHWLVTDKDTTLPENFGKVIKEIEKINRKLGELTPEQISAVRSMIESY